MKNIIYILWLMTGMFFSQQVFSQQINLEKMSDAMRKKYLTDLSAEVVKTYGPGYYREEFPPVITEGTGFTTDDERPEITKYIGKEYYVVTFLYDPAKETLDWNYAAKVEIWKDTGEPFSVLFGNGYGFNFFFKSYQERKKSRETGLQVPYQQALPPVNIFDTTAHKK